MMVDLQIMRHRLVAVFAGEGLLPHEATARLRLEARLEVRGTPRQHRLPFLISGQVQVVSRGDYQGNTVGVQGVAPAHVTATFRVLI